MITVKGLNISYGEMLIENGEIVVPDNSIVVIAGKSGSGKTSILYRLGLVSTATDYEYTIDGETIDFSNKEGISKIQENAIGFLFQEGSLIDNLSIEDNIKLAAQTSGRDITHEEILLLLEKIEISPDKLKLYPPKLSGGEKQRASLAMILAKNTKYIIADEPTASLDMDNSEKIIRIFKNLKELGYTIVISTHSKELINSADVVYMIENKRVNINVGEELVKNTLENNKDVKQQYKDNLSNKNYYWYAKHSKNKKRMLNGLLLFFCAIAISGYVISNNVISYLIQTQEDLIKRLSDNEIYAVNMSTSSTDNPILDSDGNLILEEDLIDRVSNMDGVENVYQMMEWRSFALNNEKNTIENKIEVLTDENTYDVSYSLDNTERDYYTVLPFVEEQQLGNQIYKMFTKTKAGDIGVYVSYGLAEELGILDSQSEIVRLKMEAGIPVYKYVFHGMDSQEPENHLDIVEFSTIEVVVEGILNKNVTNRYTINGNSTIYMPYKVMKEIQENTDIKGDYSGYNKEELKEWSPSAFLVYTNSYKNVDIVRGKIENLTSHIVTRYDYQDTKTLESLSTSLKSITNVVMSIILFIIFVLMFGIFVSTTIERKREYAILKANGFTMKKLSGITMYESLFQSGKILIISLIISSAVVSALSIVLMGELRIPTVSTLMFIALFSAIFVALPSLISIIYISSLKVERIIRN